MTETPSLDASNDSAREVAKTPWRVDLEDLKSMVDAVEYINPDLTPHMTIAVVLLKNGYALQGMSAPADPANFHEGRGQEFAFEDALRKAWPLEAYLMREVMSGTANVAPDRWNASAT